MIIGYVLNGSDNDSFMIGDEKHIEVPCCLKCGYLLDFNYHNPFYRIKRKVYDYSHPYDIGNIVSLKFKEFCIREEYKNIVFKEFERETNFFQLIVNNVIKFDFDRGKTRFKNFCDVCLNYEEAIITFIYLKNTFKELDNGFYRTDLVFGAKNKKNPLIIVDSNTYQKLKREKMKGLFFEPIHS